MPSVEARADDRDPLASHLALTPDAEHDGYLHLNEIAAARLGARLVVLSACETEAGRLFNGEGLMSLARGFVLAGAHGVVATRWPVGPATAELMGQFYAALAAGVRPSAALRQAQRALRQDPKTAHPFYWGGFGVIAGG